MPPSVAVQGRSGGRVRDNKVRQRRAPSAAGTDWIDSGDSPVRHFRFRAESKELHIVLAIVLRFRASLAVLCSSCFFVKYMFVDLFSFSVLFLSAFPFCPFCCCLLSLLFPVFLFVFLVFHYFVCVLFLCFFSGILSLSLSLVNTTACCYCFCVVCSSFYAVVLPPSPFFVFVLVYLSLSLLLFFVKPLLFL